MEAFALYLLKSVIWLTGFALVYFLFLRNERFFFIKRIYLVAGILLSFLLPLFTIHYAAEVPSLATLPRDVSTELAGTSGSPQLQSHSSQFDPRLILLIIYVAGFIFLAVRLIRQLNPLIRTIKRTRSNVFRNARLVRSPEVGGSFSFFSYVFINPSVNKAELEMIMNHELVHVNQKHWIDLMLVELIRLFQWMNPVAWIYSGFIRQNHEYIADQVALQHAPEPAVYKAVLVNQLVGKRIFSLSNSFDYSLNKKRFDMMIKVVTSPWRKMKVLFILPVFAIVFYAFATPEYHYVMSTSTQPDINKPASEVQKDAKGVVLGEDGKLLQGVSIIVSNSTMMTTTDANGRFALSRIPDGSSLIFTYKGYKTYILPPLISSNMALRIKLVKDPDYKEEPAIRRPQQPEPLVVIDGVITDKRMQDAYKELGYNFGLSKVLIPKEAVDKYGDKGANGVVEITTRKKALEMGLNPPMRRLAPADYPTFEGKDRMKFNEWVTEQVKYPAEAKEKKAEGYVTVNFTINLDGTLTDIRSLTSVDPSLANEVINVVKSSPKWDPPRNPEIKEPFTSGVTIGFKLPDKIIDQMPFVVVEEMPLYPGGEGELLRFIQNNLKYPEEAKAQKIEGKVIIRFVVNTEGKTEGISVIKGVHPLLDAEAIRIVSILPAFKPGMQGGKPVPVWYMVPVNFILPDTEKP